VCFSTDSRHTFGYKCAPFLAYFSFIRMRQTSYRGFSRKTKQSWADPLVSWFARWCPFTCINRIELEMKDTTYTARPASYHDLHIEIDSGDRLRTKLTTIGMNSFSPLWTFHLYVATFPLQLHMEFISLSWSDIPELVVSIRISLIEGCYLQEKVLVIAPPWLGWPLWNICVTNDNGYVPIVASTPRYFSHSWLIAGFVAGVKLERCFHFRRAWVQPRFLAEFVLLDRRFSLWCIIGRCLFFCPFSFDYCVFCPTICGFWLPLWYLQTLLMITLRWWFLSILEHEHERD
jgi:hypothetical protein